MKEQESNRQCLIAGAFDDALEEDGFAPEGYTVLGELDRGGMAVVYLAEQHEPNREVAMKVLLPRFAADEEMLERFYREGQAMANLEHSGILPVYQVGEWEGLSFIAMKLATGGSLLDLIGKKIPDTDQIVDWMISVCDAVHFAHQRGVLHRDIKPANLLFDQDGSLYVSDFGVAKVEFTQDNQLTRTKALIGTPNYLAPEIASGETNSGSVASDLYGIGATLYQCLTGKLPYESQANLAAQLRVIVDDELKKVQKLNSDIPSDLCVICEKALSKRAQDRYGSVREFAEDLVRWREGKPILARPARIIEKTWLWMKRHPLPAVLSGLLMLTLLVGGFVFFLNYQKRGELLSESLIERARAERLVREPGFRDRVLSLLKAAEGDKNKVRIEEEVIAVLAHWDVGKDTRAGTEWIGDTQSQPFMLEVEGREILYTNKSDGSTLRMTVTGVLRCPPVCSSDGRFIAMVTGERMELVIHDVLRNKEFVTVPLENWPERLIFSQSDEVLKVLFENKKASLISIQGRVLLEGFNREATLRKPIGLERWKGHFLTPVEASLYGGELTKDESLLATTSAIGVQIWNTKTRKRVDFYEVENQRIDAPTDAWWLDDERLLIQVPGAIELLEVDSEGYISESREMPRVPGATVKDVLANGDWLMKIRNEDGTHDYELWAGGDPSQTTQWAEQNVEPEPEQLRFEDETIFYKEWKLTLPKGSNIIASFLFDEGRKLLALTGSYDIYEWDLEVLGSELKSFKSK